MNRVLPVKSCSMVFLAGRSNLVSNSGGASLECWGKAAQNYEQE